MPKKAHKTIAIYGDADHQAYQETIERLAERGHVHDGMSEGEKLRVLCDRYQELRGLNENTKNRHTTRDLLEPLAFFFYMAVNLAVIVAILVGVGYGLWWVLG